jgi:Tubulin-tyrosine ligase family
MIAWLQVRADTCQDGQAQQLVAQKYVETPLLAMGRKFDIRQWVLVTCWEPLTVWFYDVCYLRFCAEDYKPSNFDNIFCHLSNNSIAKKSKKFESGALAHYFVESKVVHCCKVHLHCC